MINDKTILITGGTGSFGNEFVKYALTYAKKIIIYSRDEYKQYVMRKKFPSDKLRFFIGDVRDKERLHRAFEDVDIVVHAAALKQVPACEYNPIEAVKTNINGAENVINVAIDRGVRKIVALSSDKSCNPTNLYGATKLVSDKLFVSANAYDGKRRSIFSVVRYGNVSGSRGSVIPLFREIYKKGDPLPVTDIRMTRFWITLPQAVDMVARAIEEANGGEIYVPKIPSYNIATLAAVISNYSKRIITGIRPGEKLHETMISSEDSLTTYEYEDYYIIYPQLNWWIPEIHRKEGGKKVPDGFTYSSDKTTLLGLEDLRIKLSEI